MNRYADPTRCPDCGGAIAFRAAACPGCGLPLHGQVAQRLFETLSLADRLLVELRASSLAPAAAPVTVAAPSPGGPSPLGTAPAVASLGPPLGPAAAPRRGGISAASVPKILLGLGAACVLVAALVFLAVTWSVMGVGGRTTTLVVLTVAAGALSVWLARRDLRGAAEALALVSLGLLTLDVFGAADAGWLGDPGVEVFLVVLGTVLVVAGVGLSALVRGTPVGRLTGVQLVAGAGVLVAASGLSDVDAGRTDADLVVTVVLAALTAAGLRRIALPVAAAVAAATAGLFWVVLVAVGVDRVADDATLARLWGGLEVWPLLAAAGLAGVLAAVRSLPLPARVAAASAGTAVAAFALVRPGLGEDPTVTTLAVAGTLVVLAGLAWFAPRPWGLSAAAGQALGGLWLGAVGLQLASHGAAVLGDIATAATGTPGGSYPVTLPGGLPTPWLLPVCLVVLVGTVVAVAQASPTVDAVVGLVADLRALAAVGALTGVLTVALLEPPVWVLVALLLLPAVGFQVWWLRRGSLVPLFLTAGFLVAGVAVARYDEWLTAAALVVALGCTGHAHLVARSTLVSQVAGAVAAATVAGLAWTVGSIADADPSVTALAGLVALALLGTTPILLPGELVAQPLTREARAGLEAGAAAAAVPLGLLGVLLAAPADQALWAAGYLTLAGVAVTGTALLRDDRRPLGWPGGALLAAASWVRLWDLGVETPEAYTLPSAAALAVVGLWHLRTRPGSGTVGALGPALSLALVPSLVWALVEPDGLRVLLLGLGCLGLVVAGARLRWTAPVLFGAVVGGLLVARLAAPYVGDAMPRWVVIGAAGALLIAMGVTWERRLQQARQVRAYVLGLR